jgi:hypothetical protein
MNRLLVHSVLVIHKNPDAVFILQQYFALLLVDAQVDIEELFLCCWLLKICGVGVIASLERIIDQLYLAFSLNQ